MFIDIAKYIITIGIIGSLFSDKLSLPMAIFGVIPSLICF